MSQCLRETFIVFRREDRPKLSGSESESDWLKFDFIVPAEPEVCRGVPHSLDRTIERLGRPISAIEICHFRKFYRWYCPIARIFYVSATRHTLHILSAYFGCLDRGSGHFSEMNYCRMGWTFANRIQMRFSSLTPSPRN